jgi:hypothetical protein
MAARAIAAAHRISKIRSEISGEVGVVRGDRVPHFHGAPFPEPEDLGIGLRDIRDLEMGAIGECGTNTRAATIVATTLRCRAVISGRYQVCRPQDFRLS